MHERPRARVIGYGVALLATLVALLLRWHLMPVLGDRALYSTFFPSVLIAAYFGGFWPGLLMTILCTGIANYFLVEPFFTLGVKGTGDAVGLILFGITGTFISGLYESLHRAQRRVVADERLRAEEIEERFRQLAENIHEIFWIRDARGDRLVYISPGYEELSGRTRQSLYEQPASGVEIIHPDDRDRMVEYMEQHKRGVFTDGEFRVVRPDGTVRWVRSRAFPIKEPDGSLSRVAGLAEDITERKRTEEALRESEHRWRSLTEALPQLVWTATPDGACDYFSTQWTQHTGVPESDLLGWRWLEVLHPDDREPTRHHWKDSVAGRGPYDVEYRVRRSDGVYRWFKTRGVPIRGGGGDIVKWFGTCTDFTDFRQAEEALRESERRFRGTFENAAVGIAHTDPSGRFLRVNQKFCDIVGYTREELLERTFRDITHPDDLVPSFERFLPLIRGESPSFELEKRYLRKDGSSVWVDLSVALQRDAAGRPAYAIAVLQDVSERKRAEEELRRAKEAAESANRAKDEFLANVSHELRTPMGAILGMTELVLDTPLTECTRQSLQTVKSAADNLLGIINDLLDFSKIEAGRMELDPAPFSPRAAVSNTLQALTARAHKKGLELVGDIRPDVPDILVGDAGRLRQVLVNLVGNAIKFTEKGQVIVRVAEVSGGVVSGRVVSGEETPNDSPLTTHLSFSVTDTGIGIPADQREKIFRAFEQGDSSTTRKYGGTGLGLTIAARLVALMGGTITVDSAPGRGSIFAFTAEFAPQPHASEQGEMLDATSRIMSPASEEVGGRQSAVPKSSGPLRVLVAEDNEFNAQFLEQLLARRGHHVRLAANGREALALAGDGPFDLLLLDIHMPELDGFQVARAIRQQERAAGGHLPIIALTARSRWEDRERCIAAGMDDFLSKPVRAVDLWETIDRAAATHPPEDRGQRTEVGDEQPRAEEAAPSLTSVLCPLSSGAGLLDPAVLLAACGGDATLLATMGDSFRRRLPDHLAAVRDALRDEDAPRLREAAHKLSSMIAAFSTAAGGVSSDIEDHAARGELAETRPLVERLQAMAHELMELTPAITLDSLRRQAGG
jgi:PAS domain S-box-containing protein